MERKLTFKDLEAEIQRQGANLVFENQGDLKLYMEELPNGIQSITVTDGDLCADMLTSLPNDIIITASGTVRLYNLISIGNDVSITAGYCVNFKNLTTIGDNIRIESRHGIRHDFSNTGLTEIKLINDKPILLDVIQFLINHDICLQVSQTSFLINLAFDGVRVEITNSEREES